MRRAKWYLVIVCALAVFVFYNGWAAVWLHASTPLGSEYKYFRTDGGMFVQCEPSDLSVISRVADRDDREGRQFRRLPCAGPDVDGYHVYARVIAGHAAPAKRTNSFGDPIRPFDNWGPPGYFVIDTREHRLYDGLDKREWRKRLRRLGIKGEPRLYKPSMFDMVLGRNRAR